MIDMKKIQAVMATKFEQRRIQRDNSIIECASHPIAAMITLTDLNDTTGGKYNRIFEDTNPLSIFDGKIPDHKFEALASVVATDAVTAQAREITEYFRSMFITKSLSGGTLSDWERTVSDALNRADRNQIRFGDIKAMVKLPEFYTYREFINTLTSGREPIANIELYTHEQKQLTLVTSYTKPYKRDKGLTYYLFEDQNKCLVEIPVRTNQIEHSMMALLVTVMPKIPCHVRCRVVSDYETNYTWLESTLAKFGTDTQ